MVVKESAIQRFHTTTSNAVKQVVVNMIYLQTLERLIIHLLGFFKVPQVIPLVRHLRGYEVFLSRMATQGITSQYLRTASHIHRGRVEIVHTMLDGVIHQLVYFFLIIWKSHHAKSQQGNLLARAMLYSISHAVGSCNGLVILSQSTQRPQHTHSHGTTSTHTNTSQEISATHVSLAVVSFHCLFSFRFVITSEKKRRCL